MDRQTGEILQFANEEKLKEWFREHSAGIKLDKLPDGTCAKCLGSGRIMSKGEYNFEPCSCTKIEEK